MLLERLRGTADRLQEIRPADPELPLGGDQIGLGRGQPGLGLGDIGAGERSGLELQRRHIALLAQDFDVLLAKLADGRVADDVHVGGG